MFYGEPESKYLDSSGFQNDTININSDGKNVLEVTLRFKDDTFLNQNEAFDEISKFLPDDSKKLNSAIVGDILLVAFQSNTIAEVFNELPTEANEKTKGRILIKVVEGEKGSQVRREGETVARITVGIGTYEKKDLGLID